MIPLPTLDALDQIAIPIPCTIPWDEMHGGSRTRFCDQCQQNVHDVSELTRAEALELLSTDGAAQCLRLYKRPDGRVMTADCVSRRERAWKWLDRRSKWGAALFALVFFAGCGTQGVPGKPVCLTGEPAPARPEPVTPTAKEGAQSIALGVAQESENRR